MQIYDFEVTDSSFEEKIVEAGFDVELVLPDISSKNFSMHSIGKKRGYIWRPEKAASSDEVLLSIQDLTHDDMVARAATAEELLSFEIAHKELVDGSVLVALGEKAYIKDRDVDAVLIRLGSGEGKEIDLYPWDVLWDAKASFLVVFE